LYTETREVLQSPPSPSGSDNPALFEQKAKSRGENLTDKRANRLQSTGRPAAEESASRLLPGLEKAATLPASPSTAPAPQNAAPAGGARARGTPVDLNESESHDNFRAAPDSWEKHIQALLQRGRKTDAMEQYKALRQRFPDYAVDAQTLQLLGL
jgi:hypothetical protein